MIFRLTEQLKLAKPQSADWLAGGGEMGERIRSADWAKTPSVQLFPDPRASHDAQGRIIGD